MSPSFPYCMKLTYWIDEKPKAKEKKAKTKHKATKQLEVNESAIEDSVGQVVR